MTQKEIEKGNKLIAEFMNVKIGEDNYSYRPGVLQKLKKEHLLYHSSWDWIMPVVEKIYKLYDSKKCVGLLHCKILELSMTYNLELVYKSVIEFITWYNQNQKP